MQYERAFDRKMSTPVKFDFDHIVVGAGINGAWSAYHLAKRGYRTLIIDQVKCHSLTIRLHFIKNDSFFSSLCPTHAVAPMARVELPALHIQSRLLGEIDNLCSCLTFNLPLKVI